MPSKFPRTLEQEIAGFWAKFTMTPWPPADEPPPPAALSDPEAREPRCEQCGRPKGSATIKTVQDHGDHGPGWQCKCSHWNLLGWPSGSSVSGDTRPEADSGGAA